MGRISMKAKDIFPKGTKMEKIPLSAFKEINKHMESVRREFIIKSVQSEIEASKVFFTA